MDEQCGESNHEGCGNQDVAHPRDVRKRPRPPPDVSVGLGHAFERLDLATLREA